MVPPPASLSSCCKLVAPDDVMEVGDTDPSRVEELRSSPATEVQIPQEKHINQILQINPTSPHPQSWVKGGCGRGQQNTAYQLSAYISLVPWFFPAFQCCKEKGLGMRLPLWGMLYNLHAKQVCMIFYSTLQSRL